MSDASRIPVLLKGGARTPIGRFLGGLSHFSAPQLGAIAVRAAVGRSGIDVRDVEEVIMGNVVTAGAGQAPARQAAVGGGVPETVPALTINKVCGSGLKAVMLAAQAIRAGDARLIVAGGMESMSMVPHYLRGMRNGIKFGDQTIDDGLIFDGLWCSFGSCHMGGYAEYTANKAGVSRDDADKFSLRSHQKAVAAAEAGFFENEIIPVEVKKRKSVSVIDLDESPRGDTSLDALGKLRPAFVRDAPDDIEEHVVTAGNAPGLNDGAASVIVASMEYAKAHGLEVEALISGYATAATAPQDLFFAPVAAVQNLMRGEGKLIGNYDLFEVNEAFAVQAIADIRALEMDESRVNVNGGAVALGHPIGASGTRILVTLLNAMEQNSAASGMATLCLGGGNAVALSVEKV
ncbi:MAG TPA: acetyl-CoA C-acyltransferase [Gemmatimonadetes bacterium]|nr:acetyl-CoA C-acyltransferase [Gemmatimonadota bacterium]HBV05523.1 acetyl-CoA C-acyltransferase [Gemmatimonadota bacterium]|tara:strand:+ start:14364 stop:15578 length:1215 start_codon:yes stop_codon:yes gene_type:complete